MEALVQWATILSPLIAVAIAWWMTRNSAKDTAEKIACIKESTDREIKSLKRLAKLQISTTQIQIEKELWESRARNIQLNDRLFGMLETDNSSMSYHPEMQSYRQRDEKQKDIASERDFQQRYSNLLGQFHSRLEQLSKQLDDE